LLWLRGVVNSIPMGEHEARGAELLRENEYLREQRRAISDVLRAVASSKGLQPVMD